MAKDTPDKQLSAHELLEARVDAMMNPDESSPVAADSQSTQSADAPELDLSTDTAPGAPALTEKPVAEKPSAAEAPTPAPEVSDDIAETVEVNPAELDTPASDAAIDDIVAQEADAALAAEDAGLAAAQADAEAQADQSKPHGHPIFWFFIVLLVIIAVIAAVVLTDPNLL